MGKNKSFQGKEAFQRMNFLFQASEFLVTHLNQPRLAAYYGSQMTSICKKSVLRMEPRVKRGLCKGCRTPLVPGISSRVRLKSRVKNFNVTCVQCGTVKRFPMKAGYKLWVETPEACVQTFGVGEGAGTESKSQPGTKEGPAKKRNENKDQGKTEKEVSGGQAKCVNRTNMEEEEKVQETKSGIESMDVDREQSNLTCNTEGSRLPAVEQVVRQSPPTEMGDVR